MGRCLDLTAVAVAVLIPVAYMLLQRELTQLGEFNEIKPHGLAGCKRLGDFKGVEDITIDHATGIAYLSSDARRPDYWPSLGMRPAFAEVGIYVLDLNAANAEPAKLELVDYPFAAFRPHGISLWSDAGSTRLFVVNHIHNLTGFFLRDALFPDMRQAISVFSVEQGTEGSRRLRHLFTVEDDLFTSPNDVLAVGPDSFYTTMDSCFRQPVLRALELFVARSGLESVVYYSPQQGARIVASDLRMANGIQVSRDRKHVYVAEALGQTLHVYERAEDGGLKPLKRVHVGTTLDNIEEDDATDTLYIASHPRPLAFLRHASSSRSVAPSQCLRITNPAGKHQVTELFVTHGNGTGVEGADINAASVVAVHGDRMLIGSVFDKGVLVCPRAA